GDAAHLNNPLGGFGLNGSVHDAINLGDKLAEVYHNGADYQKAFSLYDRQRRPINIKAVQNMSIRNKKLLEERDDNARASELARLRAIAEDPRSAYEYLMNSSMINSVREASSVTLEGGDKDVTMMMSAR